jgi:hypothetical protein
MRVRIVATIAAVSLAAAPVFAQSPQTSAARESAQTPVSLSQAAQRAVSKMAGQISQGGTTSDENPYFLPGILTLSAGGLITIYGLVHESGVDCSTSISTVSCNTTHSTGVIVAGLVIAGAGGYLLYRGNQQKHSPQIVVGPGGLVVRERFSWK